MGVEIKPTAPKINSKIIIILVFGMLSFGLWLLYATTVNGYGGFPLDDGWIHQTYARNFAELGQWVYQPGQVSGGSTSPLWTLVLSFFYLVRMNPFISAGVPGFLFFFAAALVGEALLKQMGTASARFPFAALLLLLEWHVVWAALSGMETILYIFLILLTFHGLFKLKKRFFWIGLLIGLTVWVRPDALTLLGPAFFVAILCEKTGTGKMVNLKEVVLGFLLLFLPYLFFNYLVAGRLMPNTFFAKQTEYAVMLDTPIIQRMGRLFLQPLVGVGVFLVPGFIQQIVVTINKREWVKLSAVLWFFGMIMIYVLRLPVIYQHGRYLIPAMPVFFVLGLQGSIELVQQGRKGKSWQRILAITGMLSGILILIVFWIKGAQTYQMDVAVIHEEMVVPSIWIRDHTTQEALIGAHDIGALGYYGGREIVDLAGLITPEVIPFIRDEDRLLEYLLDKEIDYLMTFPDWYTILPAHGTVVYQSEGAAARLLGNTNMAVYQFRKK